MIIQMFLGQRYLTLLLPVLVNQLGYTAQVSDFDGLGFQQPSLRSCKAGPPLATSRHS
jgi:hypothetical protein